uniref:Uncharacterized protein n=1 Tax=Avena sativa TaxID=4498 RepID=A0ACD5WJ65_AVESA
MSSTNDDGGINGAAGAGGAGTTIPAPRPHWRSRDPAATVVYVVHPAQFRDVVQQLTGAAPTKTASQQAHRYAADANAAALEQRCHDGGGGGEVDRGPEDDSTRATTLRQMMEECIAWATDDDGCGYDDEDREGGSVPEMSRAAVKRF